MFWQVQGRSKKSVKHHKCWQVETIWLTLFVTSIVLCIVFLLTRNTMTHVHIRQLLDLLLCLNTRMVAPDSLAPKMRDVWLSSSLKIKQP